VRQIIQLKLSGQALKYRLWCDRTSRRSRVIKTHIGL
jgi:hypothetical protein